MIMMLFFAWNTRGFNKMRKHKNVQSWVATSNPTFGCLLETRVKEENSSQIISRVFTRWEYETNYDYRNLGRIWLVGLMRLQLRCYSRVNK